MRSIWKGAIQFGLVTIPVKLYTATEPAAGVSFNLLHKMDLSRIQMKVFCPEDNAIIERADTVKGYEYAPGSYVEITEQDFDAVQVPTQKVVEIKQFVPNGTPHTFFVEKAYYLEPEPVGRKVYALLAAVLVKNELTAIAKIALRDRESLAAINVIDGCLLLSTLQWPEEVRPTLVLDPVDLAPAELKLGDQLVAAMTDDFDPSLYTDTYKEALLKLIDAKVQGAPIPSPVAESKASPMIDLMATLEASVAATKPKKRGAA